MAANRDWREALRTLASWRVSKERRSTEVVAIAKWLIPLYASKLGSESMVDELERCDFGGGVSLSYLSFWI